MGIVYRRSDDGDARRRHEAAERLAQLYNYRNTKGETFEGRVHDLLFKFEERFSDRVDVRWKPRISLDSNETFEPDFELVINIGADRRTYFIECQDRDRYRKDILHKITYVRGKQRVMTFLFVHATPLPGNLSETMANQGVTVLSFERLAEYVTELGSTLEFTAELWQEQKKRHYEPVDLAQIAKIEKETKERLQRIEEKIKAWRQSGAPPSDELGFYIAEVQPLLANKSKDLLADLDAIILVCDYAMTEYSFDSVGIAKYYWLKGVVREMQGRLEDAELLLQHATQMVPAQAYLLESYAALLERMGRDEDAVRAYTEAIDGDKHGGVKSVSSHKPESLVRLADILFRLGHFDLAIERCTAYLDEHPDPVGRTVYSIRAESYLKLNQFPAAIEDIEKLVGDDKWRVSYYHLKCLYHFPQGEYLEALAATEAGLEIEPHNQGFHYDRACALSRLGRLVEAAAALAEALGVGSVFNDQAKTDPDLANLRSSTDAHVFPKVAKLLE